MAETKKVIDKREYKKKQNRRHRLRFFLIVLGIAAVACLVIFFRTENINILSMFNKIKPEGTAEQVGYSIKGAYCAAAFNGEVIVADENGITCIDSQNNWKWNEKIYMDAPVMAVNGSNMVAADIGGTQLCYFGKSGLLWIENFPKGIISVCLGNNGYVSVVHNEDQYRSAITYLKPDGDDHVVFTRKNSESYIITSEISEDGSQIAFSSINPETAETSTIVSFMKTDSGEVFSTVSYDGQLTPALNYLKGSELIVAGAEALDYLKKTSGSDVNNVLWTVGTVNKVFYCGKKFSDKYFIGAFGQEGNTATGETELKFFSTSGEGKEGFHFDGKVLGLTVKDGIIAVFSENVLALYNSSGKQLGKYDQADEIKNVSFISDRKLLLSEKQTLQIVSF
ncbi:MAG: DUF5711 family protein [Clostridiales bacterium]|jgi:hypothetical protein|nr:DUF5711 family protein [Clostridiales bacterium]